MKLSAFSVGLLLAAIGCGPGTVKKSEAAPQHGALKIYALKYGESFYPARLVNTTEPGPQVRLNWLAYLIEDASGQRTLIDCGFSEAKLVKRFALQKFKPLTEILATLGVTPEKIQTIILTHTHFDHAGDIDKFPNARIVLHTQEFAAPEEAFLKPVLARLQSTGRLLLLDKTTTLGALRIEPVQGHTKGSLVVRIAENAKAIVFSGDECYFAASCRAGIALPQGAVYSSEANRRFIAGIAQTETILTGHETDLQNGRWLNDQVFFFF